MFGFNLPLNAKTEAYNITKKITLPIKDLVFIPSKSQPFF